MITARLTGNFGNNLATIISSKCIAKDLGFEWGVNPHPQFDYHNGMIQTYFLDIDYGKSPEGIVNSYDERCIRHLHDGDNVDVRTFDENVYKIQDNTILFDGCWQSDRYFRHRIEEVKQWIKIKPEFIEQYQARMKEHNIVLDDNLCIMNFRGGEYKPYPRLIIGAAYYHNAMEHIKKINPDVRLLIITDDVQGANQFVPGIPAVHFDIGFDYYLINNAKYLILSNSSFPIFAAITNENCKKIIAPKYWARYNVSDGYWALGDQYYPEFDYLSREGQLQCYSEIKTEVQSRK